MQSNQMDLILASASPRRRFILEEMGFRVQIEKPDIEEVFYDPFPYYTPIINAVSKAESVAEIHPDMVVLGADTVIEFENQILGKPESMDTAESLLMEFSGKSHDVVTAVCLIHKKYRIKTVFCDKSEVFFKTLTHQTIQEYFEKVNPLDKAGAYGIQENGDMIIERFTGEIETIIGLPKTKTSLAISNIQNYLNGMKNSLSLLSAPLLSLQGTGK